VKIEDDTRRIEIEVSLVVAFGSQPPWWDFPEATPAELGLAGMAWRLDGPPSARTYRGTDFYRLPEQDRFGFEIRDRTDLWLRFDGLPSVVAVTRVRLSGPISVLNDPAALADWAADFESRSSMPAPGSPASGLPRMSRNSDFVCIAEIDDRLAATIAPDAWDRVTPNAWRRQLIAPNSDFWLVRNVRWKDDRSKLDSATLLFLFVLVTLQTRLLTDTVRGTLRALVPTGANAGDSAVSAGVEWLGNPECRRMVLDSQRTFILTKLWFVGLRVAKWSDEDSPIYAGMIERSGNARRIAERERDFESLTALVSGAALYRQVTKALQDTTVFARAIAVFGVLGTMAGVLQAIDRNESALPLTSGPSWLRFGLLIGLLSVLGMLLAAAWLILRRIRGGNGGAPPT